MARKPYQDRTQVRDARISVAVRKQTREDFNMLAKMLDKSRNELAEELLENFIRQHSSKLEQYKKILNNM